MYAVVEAGGKQYKVVKNDIILVERLNVKDDKMVKLTKVLLAKEGSSVQVGNPYLKGFSISCEVLGTIKQGKVVAYKYRRRKSSKKKIGHRQLLTRLKVKEIEIGKG